MPALTRTQSSIAAIVGLGLLSVLFVRLGLWQFQRADQEEREAHRVQERAILPPVEIPGDAVALGDLDFRRAVVRGSFEPQGRVLLDNRTTDGLLGAHVIVPLRILGSDRRLLVNRGWLARESAVQVANAGETRVSGLLVRPALPPIRLGTEAQRAGTWGDRWPYLDIAYFARTHGYEVEELVLIEDPGIAQTALAAKLEGENRWGMHVGYAIQWLAFACIALVAAALLARRSWIPRT